MIQKAIRKLLVNDPAVAAIVGTRVYPIHVDGALTPPYIKYLTVSDARIYRTIRPPRIQVSCWADDYPTVRQLAEAVIAALDDYHGVIDGVAIESIRYLNGPELYEAETRLYHIPCDFRVTYRE
ncbi:MAG TPA: DUF3168 domain-containing protein [Methanoculleus thermophilus]|jgi:hypothetical protein|nr:DUF3168 domain-containing protein [Methanoculleus thermophilus]